MTRPVTLAVNGTEHHVQVEPRALLAHVLRDDLNLTGTHIGCDTSQCGACTILLDGRAVKSCTVLAIQAEGHRITTIEGIGSADALHPLQQGFWGQARVAMRVLHPRDDHDGDRPPRQQSRSD